MEKYRKIILFAILGFALLGAASAVLFSVFYDANSMFVREAENRRIETNEINVADEAAIELIVESTNLSKEELVSEGKTATFFLNAGTVMAGLFLVVSFTGIIFFSLYFLVKSFIYDPKKAAGTLVGFAVIILILLISYIIASPNDLDGILSEELKVSHGTSKLIGAGIITTYMLAAGVFISLVYGEVGKMVKKIK